MTNEPRKPLYTIHKMSDELMEALTASEGLSQAEWDALFEEDDK